MTLPRQAPAPHDLELGVVGNGSVAALIDRDARIVWTCLPTFDSDASFCALLSPRQEGGDWTIELQDHARSEQWYEPNTAILVTRLHDRHGNAIEITDFAPRHRARGRMFHPVMLVRRVRPLAGTPRIRVLLRPLCGYGAEPAVTTSGSNHLRYRLGDTTLRLTSDVPVPMIERALPFGLDRPAHFVLGPDETLDESPADFVALAQHRTREYWRDWVRYLSIPYEWQDAVIRAAITLKLCQYEATGAIVAALTTSIPEAADTERNSVRVGNDAWRQRQNDVYGSGVLASAQLFFDRRLEHRGDARMFERLERMGRLAVRMAEQPDAGLWEFRGRAAVHTYSAAMCWAACDRLAHIATELGLDERARHWHDEATALRARILDRSWNARLGHFVDAYDGEHLDASLLLLADIGFIEAMDPRFIATVDAVGKALGRGDHLFRYIAPDDFGAPETSFNICTFWYIEALAATGRRERARAMFERMLAQRNALGLLSEDIAPATGEHWGNFPQTYSMVGLIQAAMRLSRRWEDAL